MASTAWRPGWWYSFVPGENAPGGNALRQRIENCREDEIVRIDDEHVTEPGVKGGPVRQGFETLISQDPDAVWTESCNCVTRYGVPVDASPRIRPMALFDPRNPPGGAGGGVGRTDIEITNFIGVFIESVEVSGGNVAVWARFIEYMGVEPAPDWSPATGPLVRVLRIVE